MLIFISVIITIILIFSWYICLQSSYSKGYFSGLDKFELNRDAIYEDGRKCGYKQGLHHGKLQGLDDYNEQIHFALKEMYNKSKEKYIDYFRKKELDE